MHTKIFSKLFANKIQEHIKIMHHDQVGFMSGMDRYKSINAIQQNKLTSGQKLHNKVQHHFTIKTLKRLGTERTYPIIMAIYIMHVANIIP